MDTSERASLVLAVCAVLAGGCASKDDDGDAVLAPAPLEFDPTEPYTLSEWWSDGDRLLRLGSDQAYELFDGQNRYHLPAERGRWWQQSYAALWLEPYVKLPRERRRVAVAKSAGRIVLRAGGDEPWRSLDAPPEVVEDRLLGTWRGAGLLRLWDTMRYDFSPSPDHPSPVVVVAGHRGSWLVAGDELRLQPDSPSAAPMTLVLEHAGDEILLEWSGGTLRLERAGVAPP